jgi:hypothetical protein
MNTKSTRIDKQNKNILLLALGVVLILLVPFIAMQFSDSVDWSVFDFVVVGALLFGTGLAYELLTRKVGLTTYRAAVGVMLFTALFLVWVNIAVGVIGSEDNPANVLYFGVLLVLIFGALMARFRPHGMARALFATAIAQAFVTLIALIPVSYPDELKIWILNGFFVALWVGSAMLFQSAHAALSRQVE